MCRQGVVIKGVVKRIPSTPFIHHSFSSIFSTANRFFIPVDPASTERAVSPPRGENVDEAAISSSSSSDSDPDDDDDEPGLSSLPPQISAPDPPFASPASNQDEEATTTRVQESQGGFEREQVALGVIS